MKDKTIYTITYTKSIQVAEDQWKTHPVSVELSDETTIFDIKVAFAEALGIDVSRVNLAGTEIGVLCKPKKP